MRRKGKHAGILELNSKAGKKINDISGKKKSSTTTFYCSCRLETCDGVSCYIMSPVVPDQRILKASET